MSGNPAFRLNSGPTVTSVSSGTGIQSTSSTEGLGYDKDTHPWQNADSGGEHGVSSKECDAPFCEALHDRLRDNSVLYPSQKSKPGFWPRKLFDNLMSHNDVKLLLEELAQTEKTTDNARPVDFATETISTHYRKILALLILIDEGRLIHEFVSRGIDDSKLPFSMDYAFEGLIKRSDRDVIRKEYQWKLNVPFFQSLPSQPGERRGGVSHLDISEFDIRPWDRLNPKPREVPKGDPELLSAEPTVHTSLPSSVTLAGGYGEVHQIIIHPWQHDFHAALKNVSFPRPILCFCLLSANRSPVEIN